MRCTVYTLAAVTTFSTAMNVVMAQAPVSGYTNSRVEQLKQSFASSGAVASFWSEVAASPTPLVEPYGGDPNYVLVTFLYRGHANTMRVEVTGAAALSMEAPENLLLTRLADTDVWYRTLKVRREARFGYLLRVTPVPAGGTAAAAAAGRGEPDALNPNRYNNTSRVVLPGAPPQPYAEKHVGVAEGQVERRRFASRVLNNERDLQIYTPPSYSATGPAYPLLIHFDLQDYGLGMTIPTSTILDNLIAERRIPPMVAVLVGNTNRDRELPCNADFIEFVHQELLPMVRKDYHVVTDAAQTIAGGSSFGGLASACLAMKYSQEFGNVLSQAGAFYWDPTTHPETVINGRRQRDPYAESNWVSQEIVRHAKLPIRFFLHAGAYDTTTTDRQTNILESNRRLKDVLRAKGYEVSYTESFCAHDPLCWRGTLSDGLIFLAGPWTKPGSAQTDRGIAVTASAQGPRISILVDLDPQRVDRSIAVESIAADAEGRLYVPDGVTGRILRVDPRAPKPMVVGQIPMRETRTAANSNGLAFGPDGDLYIAKGSYNEVLRIRRGDLNPDRPGVAETYATETINANGLVFDRHGTLFVSGTDTGNLYRVRPGGGRAEVAFHRDGFFSNGLALHANGTLYATDTRQGAIWTFDVREDGRLDNAQLFVRSPLLARVDGIAFDPSGTAWCTLQRNALVTVTPRGAVREVAGNGSRGPLEAPTGIVFVGPRAYVNNYDTIFPPNGDGKTSDEGVGASIVLIDP